MITRKKLKYVGLNSLFIIVAVILAIGIKALMPISVNVEDFDGFLVQRLGFPLVAILYFIMLYMHCIMTMRFFGLTSTDSNIRVGIRYGIAFSLIYIVGMQEVVVEASPYKIWGSSYVIYQFIIGISDALPAFLLCIGSAYYTFGKKSMVSDSTEIRRHFNLKTFLAIVISFFIVRTIAYETGIIVSNCDTFPVPCYIWTFIFGVVLGVIYFILYPYYLSSKSKTLRSFQLVVLTIGVNWLLFNSFIGFIMSGAIGQTILRSSIDIFVLFIVTIVFEWREFDGY